MAQTAAIVDKLLTNESNMLVPEGYISELILPVVKAKQKSGKFGKYGTSHLRIEHSFVAGRSEYRRVEPIVRSSDSYAIESHGLESIVTEDDYDNVELPYDAENDEVMGLTQMIWLTKEQALADTLTSTSVLAQNVTLTGTDQYNDYNNSDPLGDFKTARLAVKEGCGFAPNVAWMSWEVANTLAFSPQMLEALGFTQNRAGQLSDAELAKAMGVQRLYIGGAVKESAKEGQTSDLAPVWGKHVGFGYIPAKAGKYQTSLGYRVVLSSRPQRRVFKYKVNNPPNATGILVDDSYDFLITNANAGYLIKDAIA